MKNGLLPLVFASALLSGSALAADLDTKLLARPEAAEAKSSLGETGFGENIDLRTGSTSFSYTDVSIPVSDALAVQFGRKLALTSDYFDHYAPTIDNWSNSPTSGIQWERMILGLHWEADLPFMRGIYDARTGWVSTPLLGSSASTTSRCSASFEPPTVQGVSPFHSQPFKSSQYWGGIQINLPGRGERSLVRLANTAPTPQDGRTYVGGTAAKDRIACLPSLKNGAGEGFLLVAPDGTKFYFDWIAVRHRGPLVSGATFTSSVGGSPPEFSLPQTMLPLVDAYIFATRIEDRFGNWVAYEYDAANPFRLIEITSSAQAKLSFEYNAGGQLQSVSAGSRTWTYGFDANRVLTSTTLPDGRAWSYTPVSSLMTLFNATEADARKLQKACVVDLGTMRSSSAPESFDVAEFAVTTPSSARARFVLREIVHGTNNAPGSCQHIQNSRSTGPGTTQIWWETLVEGAPLLNRVVAISSKDVEGPGAPLRTWRYQYEPSWSYASQCASGACGNSSKTIVTSPGQIETHYTFGNDFQSNLGLLLEVSTRVGPAIARQTVTQYVQGDTWGKDGGPMSSPVLHRNQPESQSSITQDGVTFTTNYSQFDSFARPLAISESSSTGSTRSSVVAYHDNLVHWVLGQQSRNTVNGVEVSRTEFNALAQPLRQYSFGQLQQSLSYHPNGTVHTITDGRNQTTTLTNWYRGIPQAVSRPDRTTLSAQVSPEGWLTSLTDQNNLTTAYGYDPMGRLNSVSFPAGPDEAYNPKSISLTQLSANDAKPEGIVTGQWRLSETRGDYVKTTYLDALYRPTLTVEADSTNEAATQRSTRTAYDAEGRVAFQSYAVAGAGSVTQGVRTEYDALGRVTRVTQDSELGPLTTATEYLSGFRTRVTNPKGLSTTTSFKVFGTPSTDWPVRIEEPEGVTTLIDRDDFGKPTLIRRMVNGASVVRSFLYDPQQRLCRAYEPESNSTVFDYDSAGNLVWSASGLTSTTSDCALARSQVPASEKVQRTYDAMNRVLTVRYPDGLGDLDFTYTPDGLIDSATAKNGAASTVVSSFAYNRLRLPTVDRQQVNGTTSSLTRAYNANGAIASLTHPGGFVVDLAPNAFGAPTRVGSFATAVAYWPDGSVRSFTYGNGLVHESERNLRGLPDRMRDHFGGVAVFDDGYDYDANGNVAAISDGLLGARGNRDMTYDGRDRLKTVTSKMYSPTAGGVGTASYSYDAADNLTAASIASTTLAYYTDPQWRLGSVRNLSTGVWETYTYDARGNLRKRGTREYVFDFGNRLREAEGVEAYGYDAAGRRTEARHPTQGAIWSFYDGGGVLRTQRDERKGESTDYFYLGNRLIAQVKGLGVVLPAPTLTVPESSTGAYTVSWTAFPVAARYELWESSTTSSWRRIQSTAATSRAITGKAPGTYRYRVRLVTVAGTPGPYSAERSVVVTAPPPPTLAPSLSAPATSGDGTFTVAWSTVSGASHYELQQQMNGGGWGGIGLAGATTSWTSDRWGAGSYAYRARACNASGCGPYSNTATVVVEVPPAPTDASVVTAPATNTSGNYSVSWTAVPRAATYEVWEQANGGNWSLLNQFATGTSVFRPNQLTGSYTYRVRGCNANGCGPYSNTPTTLVELEAPPEPPSVSVPATSSTGAYTVSWTRPPGTAHMNVEESFEGMNFLPVLSNTTTTSLALTGRSNGQYRYRVNACNSYGCSVFWMAPNAITVEKIALTAPTLSAPATNASGSYLVSWSPVSGATAYELWEHRSSVGWTLLNTSPAISFNPSGRAADTYLYRVRALGPAGPGPYSNQVTVVVGGP